MKLVEIRYSRNMTQLDVAKLSGITREHIADYERGHTLPGYNSIQKLCKALNCTATELLGF